MNKGPYTVHGARDISTYVLLRHASQNEGETALCGTVKSGNLCDAYEVGEVTCPVCLARIRVRGLSRADK